MIIQYEDRQLRRLPENEAHWLVMGRIPILEAVALINQAKLEQEIDAAITQNLAWYSWHCNQNCAEIVKQERGAGVRIWRIDDNISHGIVKYWNRMEVATHAYLAMDKPYNMQAFYDLAKELDRQVPDYDFRWEGGYPSELNDVKKQFLREWVKKAVKAVINNEQGEKS